MHRREFVKRAGIGMAALSVAGSSAILAGCGNIYATILAYTTAGLQAFQSVVDLLEGAGIINPAEGTAISLAVAAVKAAFADIQTAVAAYDAAPAADKLTLGGKIATAIQIAEAQIQQFWNDLHIPGGGLISLVKGLLGIILSTLTAFLPQLPKPAGTASIVRRSASLGDRISYTPQKRTVKQFRHEINELLEQNGKPKVF